MLMLKLTCFEALPVLGVLCPLLNFTLILHPVRLILGQQSPGHSRVTPHTLMLMSDYVWNGEHNYTSAFSESVN